MERAALRSVLRATGCAVERSGAVFLVDRDWPAAEREQAERLMAQGVSMSGASDLGWVAVRTGGSGGEVKFARHDEATLGAAARGFCQHFGLARVNAVDVLPPQHVSGLMARIRCAVTGGAHRPSAWKRLEAGDRPEIAGDDWVISLVPTQLQRLLASAAATDWLRGFRLILVGGGPVWPTLAEMAAEARLRVSLSYGMTETAAMIAALQPGEFLRGDRSSGAVMPHARVWIDASGGRVRVAGESVFRGYWPEWRDTREWGTADLGEFDAGGHLHVLGRSDAMIITGGKKVQPAEVEAALRASGEFADVAVIGVPDLEWGEVVVACYPSVEGRAPDCARAVAALAPHQRPKRFVAIAAAEWPRNAQGKINRRALEEAISGKR